MKKLNKKHLILACLSLSVVAGATGVASVSFEKASADSLVSADMQMEKGASLYLNDVSGLKFSYTVANYDASKTYGMLIVPYDYLDDAGITDLTNVENDYVNALQNANLPKQPIIAEVLPVDGVFSHSIGELNEYNYARAFFGIGYVKTGENTYEYATQNDNVRSVFEVANLALNVHVYDNGDLNGDGQESADEKIEYDKIDANKQTVENFVTTGFEFVYGENATPTISMDSATYIGADVTPTLENQKVRNIDLAMYWNVDTDALTRGKDQNVAARLGGVYTQTQKMDVLKDETELELYNNSNRADFFAVDGKIQLAGGYYINSTSNTEQKSSSDTTRTPMGHVAFKDKYTLDEKGTYIDIYFTGNNMPNVEFFAENEPNGLFMDTYADDGKGFIVSNGLAALVAGSNLKYYYSGYSGYFNYGISAYNTRWAGPERGNLGRAMATYLGTAEQTGSGANQNYTAFSMYSLAHVQDANQQYRYTVGMYLDGNRPYVDAKLYKINDSQETLFAEWKSNAILEGNANNATKSTLDEGQVISGYIVLHAAAKGGTNSWIDPTVFTCSKPYTK